MNDVENINSGWDDNVTYAENINDSDSLPTERSYSIEESRSNLEKAFSEMFGKDKNAIQNQPQAGSENKEDFWGDILKNKHTDKEALDPNAAPQEQANVEDWKPYKYEDEYGNSIELKSKEDMNTIIQKGVYAEQVYKNAKELEQRLAEQQETVELWNHFEKLRSENPGELIKEMLWEMSPQDGATVLMEFAKLYEGGEEGFAQAKKLREYDLMQKQQEREALLQEKRAALEAEQYEKQTVQAVENWMGASDAKWKAKLPAEYHDFVDEQINLVLQAANSKLHQGQDIKLSELNAMLDKSLSKVAAALSSSKTNSIIGKQVEANKTAATSRVQNATASVPAKPAQDKSKPLSVEEKWKRIEEGIKNGTIDPNSLFSGLR